MKYLGFLSNKYNEMELTKRWFCIKFCIKLKLYFMLKNTRKKLLVNQLLEQRLNSYDWWNIEEGKIQERFLKGLV